MMRMASDLAKGTITLLRHPGVIKGRQYIFLLSHMRSFSTLLCHILGNNPEISGYTEGQHSYAGGLGLFVLRVKAAFRGNYKPNSTYVLDKVLHNKFAVPDSILKRDSVHCLFLVRQPLPTLKSIVNMWRKGPELGLRDRPVAELQELAQAHYVSRLDGLVDLATRLKRLGKTPVGFRAERIVEDTSSLLRDIEGLLRLGTPLEEKYSTFSKTGLPFFGDMSEHIRSGEVRRERPDYADIAIAPEVLAEATAAYDRCMSHLGECCALPP
jgi:hypothetical protein